LKNGLTSLYLTRRAFAVGWGIVLLFLFAQAFPYLLGIAQGLITLVLFALIGDLFVLYRLRDGISGHRKTLEKWSNGDENPVTIHILNHYPLDVDVRVLDELPDQFQKRDLVFKGHLEAGSIAQFPYAVRPLERGVYRFGAVNVFVSTALGFVERRYALENAKEVAVYPSYLNLRRYELMAISDRLIMAGQKKVRRAAQQVEFDRIKDYVPGDDRRTVNQKATARRGRLMVNQYQDEKAQQMYALIDAGRTMKMPFNGLSLLDHAINAALVISNVAIRKDDRVGLMIFSKGVQAQLPAGRERGHMNKVLEMLYALRTNHDETDMDALYVAVKRNIPQRSLLLLFTNFETKNGLERQLSRIQALAATHLVVVIFFLNTELEQDLRTPAKNTADVYQRTITERYLHEKRQVAKELERRGIASILTRPQDLSVNVINKYLEIKARGIL
jgi:uncharacterized protein (DUF58 family)